MKVEKERWRRLTEKGLSNYRVSSLGRVWSVSSKQFLSQRLHKGYLYVDLYSTKKVGSVSRLVHRLVAREFLGMDSSGHAVEVNHVDTNKLNNKLSNFECTTPSGNAKHAVKMGKHFMAIGSTNPNAKLTESAVRSMRRDFEKRGSRGKVPTIKILAKKYGMSRWRTTEIIRGTCWRHVK